MLLENALSNEIGNIKNSEDLLLGAMLYLLLYTIKKRNKKEKTTDISDKEYTIEDAFRESLNKKIKLHPVSQMIPSPS